MTDAGLRERLKGRDPIAELEAWHSGHKSRSCSIDIDNGYGATCWRVILDSGSRKVEAAECSFYRIPKGDCPADVVFLRKGDKEGDAGGEWEDWPGLGPVILAAIDRWNEAQP